LETNPKINLSEENGKVTLRFDFDKKISSLKTRIVTTELLEKAIVPNLSFENRDGTPLKIDYDYLGIKRNNSKPAAGPFEKLKSGENLLKIW
jgi:alpha-N-arabinofuranosidase